MFQFDEECLSRTSILVILPIWLLFGIDFRHCQRSAWTRNYSTIRCIVQLSSGIVSFDSVSLYYLYKPYNIFFSCGFLIPLLTIAFNDYMLNLFKSFVLGSRSKVQEQDATQVYFVKLRQQWDEPLDKFYSREGTKNKRIRSI